MWVYIILFSKILISQKKIEYYFIWLILQVNNVLNWCEISSNLSWLRVKVIWRRTGWRERKISHLRLQQSSDTAMSRKTQKTEAQMGEFGKTQHYGLYPAEMAQILTGGQNLTGKTGWQA